MAQMHLWSEQGCVLIGIPCLCFIALFERSVCHAGVGVLAGSSYEVLLYFLSSCGFYLLAFFPSISCSAALGWIARKRFKWSQVFFFFWFKVCLVLFNWPRSTALWSIYCSYLMGCLQFQDQPQQPCGVYFHADDMFTVNNKNWHVLCAQVNAPKSGAINCCGWVAGARTCFYFIEHHSEVWKTHQLISCFLYSLQAKCMAAFFFPSPISCAWSGEEV